MANNFEIRSHFFTELTGITQSFQQAFGPLGNTLIAKENEFQVTSLFTAASSVKIYSICKSNIFVVQQVNDPTKVNLILKPIDQPCNQLKVKYFVYRGIDLASFFSLNLTSNNERKVIPYSQYSTSSEFVQSLWDQFLKLNGNAASTQDFLARWIGFEIPNTIIETSLESIFYKQSPADIDNAIEVSTLYELPIVNQGMWLGNAIGEFGIEIILETGGELDWNDEFKLDLQYASLSKQKFDCNTLAASNNEKLYRECVLQFIDPCAFWGLHISNSNTVSVRNYSGSTFTTIAITSNILYNNLLSLFTNKNRMYYYLYSELGRSYNYYGNYFTDDDKSYDLGVSIANSNFNLTKFGSFKWPLVIVENNLNFKLKLPTSRYAEAVFCHMIKTFTGEQSFLYAEDLVDHESLLSKEINIEILSLNDGASEVPISSIQIGFYSGVISYAELFEESLANPIIGVIKCNNPHNLLAIRNKSNIFNLGANIIFNYSLAAYCGNLIKFVSKDNIAGTWHLLNTMIHFDNIKSIDNPTNTPTKRVLFETRHNLQNDSSINSISNSSNNKMELCFDSFETYNVEINNFFKPNGITFELIKEYDDGINENIKILKTVQVDASYNEKLLLGITLEEYDKLHLIVSNNQLLNASIYLHNEYESLAFFSQDGVKYFVYYLYVLAESKIDNKIVVIKPLDKIIVYSTDNNLYHSHKYSKEIPEMTLQKHIIQPRGVIFSGEINFK
jgi:hypothetical protein